MRQNLALGLVCLAFAGAWSRFTQGAETRPISWLTGPQLREHLERPIDASWSKRPLARILESLSVAQRVAIVRDRRVDPNQSLELTIEREPLDLALRRIAQRLELGVSQLESIVYLGPPRTAERLRSLAALKREAVQSLPLAQRQKLLRTRAFRWDDLTAPRDLASELAAEAGVEIASLDSIPHDLWGAADLPPMSWTDRLTIVLAQFDLTFEVDRDGGRVRLTPLPERVEITRRYPGGGRADELARKWSGQLPAVAIRALGDEVVVTGRAEDHDLIDRARQGGSAKRQEVVKGKEVYKLSVENVPLLPLLSQLEQRLKIEIHYDRPTLERAKVKLDQLVSVQVQDASLDDLLRAILNPAGLNFTRRDRVVELRPAEK